MSIINKGFITQLHLHPTPPTSSFCLSSLLLQWEGRCRGCDAKDRRNCRGGVCCSNCLECGYVTPACPCELTLRLEGMTAGDDCIMTVIANVNPAVLMFLPFNDAATPLSPQLCYSVHSNKSAPAPKFILALLHMAAATPLLRQTISADK